MLSVNKIKQMTSTLITLHKYSYILHQLLYFHVTEGFVPDVMHDVLEGCLPFEVKEMSKVFIQEKIITHSDLNDSIQSFPYGSSDVCNKPGIITSKILKSSDPAFLKADR